MYRAHHVVFFAIAWLSCSPYLKVFCKYLSSVLLYYKLLNVVLLRDFLQDSGTNTIMMDDWITFLSSQRVAHLVKVIIRHCVIVIACLVPFSLHIYELTWS